MKHRLVLLVAGIGTALLIGGCASSLSGSSYSREQARVEQSVRMGSVESVRQVEIEGTRSGIGPAAGGVVGGITGSRVGHGKGSQVAAVIGAVAGGVTGRAAEDAATRKQGLEITIKLDDGHLIAITQEADEVFKPGERVRVVSGAGATRVSH